MVNTKETDSPAREEMHDHGRCVEEALEGAAEICTRRGAKLTPLRLKVLELVWSGHRPISAYDILERLQSGNKKAAPPTVYRALDFLLGEGLVHRLESLNAYIGCPDPATHHNGQFLICEECRKVTELNDPSIGEVLRRSAQKQGFSIRSGMVEIIGLCPQCQMTANAERHA